MTSAESFPIKKLLTRSSRFTQCKFINSKIYDRGHLRSLEGQIYLFTAKSATFEPFYAEKGASGLKSGLLGHRKAGQTKKSTGWAG